MHDVGVTIVEQEPEIRDGHPKGRSNDLRTLEHYRRWRVSDELRGLGWQTRNPRQQLILTETLLEKPLGAYPLQYGRHAEESHDLAAEPSFSVPQPITMRVLQKRALELNASIFRGWKVVSVCQGDEEAEVQLQCPATGAVRWIRSKYVVGCDGPGSLVRKSAGIKQKCVGPIGRVVSYVVRSEGHKIGDMVNSPAHDSLGMLMVLNSNVTTIISIPGEEAWGFSITIPADAPDPTDGEVQSFGQAVLGAKAKFDIVSLSSFQVLTRVAESYRNGRLFIAGDAAHLCPPTGGHNMNVGIEDAVNLAWKLAASLKGWGGETLLDSYDAERRAVGEHVAGSALNNSYAMRKVDELFKGLPSLDENASELQRYRRGQLAYDMTNAQWNINGIVLGQSYNKSRVVVNDGWDPAPYDPTRVCPHANPGHRAPHLWLPDGSPLLDHLGAVFTLLEVGAAKQDVQKLVEAAIQVGLPLTRLQLSPSVARRKYPAEITIIRPDQYISWQGNHCEDPVLVIDRIRGI